MKILNFLENESGRGSCPSSFPSGNQLTVHRSLPSKIGATKMVNYPKNGRDVNVLLDDLAKKPHETLWHVSLRFTGDIITF